MAAAPASPLAHLRVIDLTDLRGALAGRMLADLGADVVKVERPTGDPDRGRPPFGGTAGGSLPFAFRHAGKRGAVIDLDAAGRERLAHLCDQADVLVENLAPDARAAWQLEPAAVRVRHSRLVHVVIADCGLSGPRAGWRLEALPALAASGALFASGPRDRPPCGLPGHLAHDCAGTVAVVGALAALRDRERTGEGQTVEVSVEEAALAGLAPWGVPLVDYARIYRALPEVLARDGDGPALVVPVADGWIRFLAVTPQQWRGLAALLAGDDDGARASGPPAASSHGAAERGPAGALLGMLASGGEHLAALAVGALARLPLGGSGLAAVHGALEVLRHVASVRLRARTRADLLAAAGKLRLPATAVQTPAEFTTCEQTTARGFLAPAPDGPLAGAPFAVFPARLSLTPARAGRPAPEPGDDDGRDFGEELVAARQSGPVEAADGTAGAAPPRHAATARGLVGLRVVDLGVGAVGPELCRQLAELGADVVKLEAAGSPDFLRRITPEPGALNRSWMFNDTDRGRRSVRLDLHGGEGRALALRLCAAADVVVENRTAGVVERWGLGYDDVRARRPDVIWVSSQGFGRGGPLGTAPAYGPLAAAYAGVSWLWSHPDAAIPVGTSLEHPDHFAARLLAVAVLAALVHRDRTGAGQVVECAQTEAAAYPLGEYYLAPTPDERGNAPAHACPHGVYPAAGSDRWVAVSVVGDAAYERLRRCLGWADDPALATLAGRLARRQALDARLAAWTAGREAMAAAEVLQVAGVSAMPVQGPHELRADAHLAVRHALVTADDPEIGTVRHVGSALRMTATPVGAPGPAPALGAHTDEVLADWLGLGGTEVAALAARGVLG